MTTLEYDVCSDCDRTAERECDNCGSPLCKCCYYPLGLCEMCLEDDNTLHFEDEGTEDEYFEDRPEGL